MHDVKYICVMSFHGNQNTYFCCKQFDAFHVRMDSSEKIGIKILILGPLKSGKTQISNYLADTDDIVTKEYRPTQGVRIVEFESNQLKLQGQNINAEVELWDCSGDRCFEDCWPAIRHNSNGAIFICSPELHTGEDLLMWYNEFATKGGINQGNVVVFLHSQCTDRKGNDSILAEFKIPMEMNGIEFIPVNIEHDGDQLRLAFNNFLCRIIANTQHQP